MTLDVAPRLRTKPYFRNRSNSLYPILPDQFDGAVIDDILDEFFRKFRKFGVGSPIVERTEFRERLGGRPQRKVRPEQKAVDHVIFKRQHQPVINLPFAMEARRKIGKNLRML